MSNFRSTFGNTVTRLPGAEDTSPDPFHQRPDRPSSFGPAELARLAPAGLRAFVRIAEVWGLSVDEQLILLGGPPRSTFFGTR